MILICKRRFYTRPGDLSIRKCTYRGADFTIMSAGCQYVIIPMAWRIAYFFARVIVESPYTHIFCLGAYSIHGKGKARTDQSKTKANTMSNYTEKMVAAMTAKGSFTFAEAEDFAKQHNLSTRSVVSKVKSLGLAYTPKPKAARKNPDAVRKADIVTAIAATLGADADKLSGLAKADTKALAELVRCIGE